MKKLAVLNINGEKVNDISLKETVWGIEPNDAVLYDAVRLTRNAERQGSAETKTRDEVSGGGVKPWKQKGTGRARQGSIRAPHWYHGGVVFGPHSNRNYTTKMNRKERRLALKSALAYKVIESELIVVDDVSEDLILASRNLKNVILLSADEINVMDIISADKMIITEKAVKAIEEVLD